MIILQSFLFQKTPCCIIAQKGIFIALEGNLVVMFELELTFSLHLSLVSGNIATLLIYEILGAVHNIASPKSFLVRSNNKNIRIVKHSSECTPGRQVLC